MAGGAVLRGFLPQYSCRLAATAALMVPRICSVSTVRPGSCCHHPQWFIHSHHPQCVIHSARTIHQCPAMCAGHNKWSKVKDIKIPKDAARGRMMMKYAMMIKIAVKEGGPNPEFNNALANLIEQCRGKSLPKASIEAAIKGAEKSKAGTQCVYEARGPGGCTLLIEVLTDNTTRSHQEIKHILAKNGGALCDGARHNFSRKGVVVATMEGLSSERALELAIEAGAEDMQETEDEEDMPILQFICDMSSMHGVRAALQELGVRTVSAGLEFVSHTPAPLPRGQLGAAATLLEALNDCPDVVRVWDNIQPQD